MARSRKPKPPPNPFRWFDSSPEVIRLVVMMYVRYPLSLRNVEDVLHERGIDICHETVRKWVNRFGPMFANQIRRKRVEGMRSSKWRWHLDEVYVKINGEMHYLWRAVDHEGEVLESYVTKERDKAAALKFIKKALKRHGSPKVIVTDGLRSYGAALKELQIQDRQEDDEMKKFWFKVETIPRPTAINLGCGITATDRQDADTLFRERIQSRLPNARSLQVYEIMSINDLEAKHVRPNIGNMDVRGVWFPQGY